MRAGISGDGWETWGRKMVLRDDWDSPDLGYPRTVLLPDGRILAVYYFNKADGTVDCEGGVRRIAATIFDAPY